MQLKDIGQHLLDIGKGMVAAALMSALLGALQYLGAHIPDLLQLLASSGGAVAAIKSTRT